MDEQRINQRIDEEINKWMQWNKTLERFIEYTETPIPLPFIRAFEEEE